MVTLQVLSDTIKLNLAMDVALSMQKYVNESWQVPEVSALRECTDEKSNRRVIWKRSLGHRLT